MKKLSLALIAAGFIFLGAAADSLQAASAAAVSTDKEKAAALEKEKAMKNPFANDLGPETLDVSSYPKEAQEGYKILTVRCAKCHSAARPLNSQFAETGGKDLKERQAALAALKKSASGFFKDKNVLQVEADIWQRYVKRMMSKPGCEIPGEEGKKIWAFLVHDSSARKLGAKNQDWMTHRKKLLAQFKEKHPQRYKELYEQQAEAKDDNKKKS